MNSLTIDDRLKLVNFRPTGFDYMRIALSIFVLLWHAFDIVDGGVFLKGFMQTRGRALHAFVLPMFFALSGFLVTGSLLRCKSLISFLGLRGIRIFPALAVETFTSAIVIGAIFTTLPLSEYFAHTEFRQYLLNSVGIIHFSLPGVFDSNPVVRMVNRQLWTVPFELECYIALSVLAVCGVVRNRSWALLCLLLLTAFDIFSRFQTFGVSLEGELASGVRGRELVQAFLGGVTVFLYKERLPYSAGLGIASAIATYVMLLTPNYGDALAIIPLSYLTAWLGLMNPRKIYLLKGADYSYGIYLYGYAVQQAVQQTIPTLNWAGNFVVSLGVVSVLAAVSWIYVEKPALKARPALMAFEAKALAYIADKRRLYGILIARNAQA